MKRMSEQTGSFLGENYRVILIPKFEVSRKVKNANRKRRTKTVRRETLKSRAALFPWCKVVEVDEMYTSKTCEESGTINSKLGENKTYKCPCRGYLLPIAISKHLNNAYYCVT